MQISYLGHTKDLRTNTHVIYAKMSPADYLTLVGEDFAQFEIQRKREKHRAYARLKTDLINGALLPSITLAVKLEYVDSIISLVSGPNIDRKALNRELGVPGRVQILDGLQRTHIMKDIEKQGISFMQGQTVLVEFWLETNLRNLIYRIIVLNAGQKPMTMRHQVELLFHAVRDSLQEEIPGLEIFVERDSTRRTRARKYPLDRVVTAYQSFLTKSPEVSRENIVAQSIVDESILESSEQELGEQFEAFTRYLARYAELDDHVCRIYAGGTATSPESGVAWFGSENVMNSFFAAVADFGSTPDRIGRIDRAIDALYSALSSSDVGDDPLGLNTYGQITRGFNPRKENIGYATRRLLAASFKEYFRDEGVTSLERCWLNEAK